jgi:hypothetical protein
MALRSTEGNVVNYGARTARILRIVVAGLVAGLVAATTLSFASAAHAGLRAPGMEVPKAGASVQALPTFSWRAVPGAATYDFQIAADRKFASIVLGTGKGKGSQRTRNTAASLDKTLPDGTYYWRVRAITKKDNAGRWSAPRTFKKAWTTAPTLEAPGNGFNVDWPVVPLVLRWSTVPHATKYLVTVATDSSLAQSVLGAANKPVETQGTVFSPQGNLPSGTYYWAITPVDAGGQRGRQSEVRSFTWSWLTATNGTVIDLNDTPQVFDPLLSWDPVAGAARYEVEINPTDQFSAGSRVCCKERVLGTSLAPLRVLPDNTYHWRVRAYDADGNPGQWNVGPTFVKTYDLLATTIPGLHLRDQASALAPGSATAAPVIAWDPVPGAAEYQVSYTTFSGGNCAWPSGAAKTSSTSWTPLASSPLFGTMPAPGGIGVTASLAPNGVLARSGQPFIPERAYFPPGVPLLSDGVSYCVRVRALSDDSYAENDSLDSRVISQWTQLGAANQAAFTYQGPPPASSDPPLAGLGAPQYLEPTGGQVVRTPLLRWQPTAGARRYFVLVARDPNFTDVVDAAYTFMPAYTPNLALEDEETSYYWVVLPSNRSDGALTDDQPTHYNPQSFRKLSTASTLLAPAPDAAVLSQPTFRWTPSESAQKYRVQVSGDPQFGTLIDDVVTASTAYTSQTTYPADTILYWRVRGEQRQVLRGAERVELRWSQTGTFRRTLQAPVANADNPTGGTLIPAFIWSAVPGAISYDMHVDQADGVAKDFTLKSTAFTPTLFYGNGIFRIKVRANFATRTGMVASAYFPSLAFTRVISAPGAARLQRTKTRLLFSWNPTAAATRYLVEVSRSDSFAQIIDSTRTDNTSWAPDMMSPLYAKGGALYWRVASVDAGNNVGAYASGSVGVKQLTVIVRGTLKRNAGGRITVSVRYKGRAIGAAAVRVSGAGVAPKNKRTSKRGAASFVLRPTKAGKVTVTVSRAGYATRSVSKSVK